MKHLARVVPVDLVGIGREPTEWSIEFVLGNKESRIIFVPDVVTEAVNRKKERIIRMWCDVREACENARLLGFFARMSDHMLLTSRICLLGLPKPSFWAYFCLWGQPPRLDLRCLTPRS